MVNVVVDVVKMNGMKGFWSGVSVLCVWIIVGVGLYFFLFERVTREFAASFNKEKVMLFECFVMMFGVGCLVRMVVVVLLNFIIVVKMWMEYVGVNVGVR